MNTYYHNPKCSKSRAGLEILKQEGVEFTIKEYLKEPPTVDELKSIFNKLGDSSERAVRTGEALFKELGLNKEAAPTEMIEVLVEHPKLLERPILVTDTSAIIGRPPEDLKKIL